MRFKQDPARPDRTNIELLRPHFNNINSSEAPLPSSKFDDLNTLYFPPSQTSASKRDHEAAGRHIPSTLMPARSNKRKHNLLPIAYFVT